MTRAEIIRRLGPHDADRVFRAFGGTRLSIPARVALACRLSQTFDATLATRLVLHFGGNRFYVPLAEPAPIIDTRKLKRLIRKGFSNARIARALQCSERTVEKRRAKMADRSANTKADRKKPAIAATALQP